MKLFVSGVHPYILEAIFTRKSLYIPTDRAMNKANKVEVDNSVKIYKVARNAMDRLNHKFNRPEATVIFHKEIKFIMNNPIY